MRSSTMYPPSLTSTPYLALPTFIFEYFATIASSTKAAASVPVTRTSPIWERSKMPAASRTARCSASSEPYFSGMSQPPKSVNEAPSSACSACSGVSLGFCVFSVITCPLPRTLRRPLAAVTVGSVDAADRREVLRQPQARGREDGGLAAVLAVPVVHHHGRRVGSPGQRGLLIGVLVTDRVDLGADGAHGLDEAVEFGL